MGRVVLWAVWELYRDMGEACTCWARKNVGVCVGSGGRVVVWGKVGEWGMGRGLWLGVGVV